MRRDEDVGGWGKVVVARAVGRVEGMVAVERVEEVMAVVVGVEVATAVEAMVGEVRVR